MCVGMLATAACATAQPHVINRGRVTSKSYNAGHWERIDRCVKWKPNAPKKVNEACTSWTSHYDWDDECYQLELHNDSTARDTDVCVTKVVYENYRVGDQYTEPH